ncbi:hypothetical protein [Amycolatopsis jiangsuensis]|uniref:Uncharacterized protein n=1 Tax=Amycolatopsis jiangsuensis TaxID=1181879 RepID=A0A840IMM1_9PSEU|nr:hypothetical protein [Amycolatopsis jiangsuensis]MBB4683586.1 hypothetical protein [Amycolatopsis jiangsuensis]
MICVSDDGTNVGGVEKSPLSKAAWDRRTPWQSYYRRVGHTDIDYWRGGARNVTYQRLEVGSESIDDAIDAIFSLFHFGDVLAARERESGRSGSYLATMDPGYAVQFADLELPAGITRAGENRVRFTNVAVAYFRGEPVTETFVDADDRLYLPGGEEPCQLVRER